MVGLANGGAGVAPEIYWAALAAVLTALLWVPHILQRIIELGPYEALRDPRHEVPTKAPWAQRAIRAHDNAVENLVVFGILALAVGLLGLGDGLTAGAAGLYVAARLLHYPVYVLGLPWLRTPAFLLGFGCQLVLAGRLLGLV